MSLLNERQGPGIGVIKAGDRGSPAAPPIADGDARAESQDLVFLDSYLLHLAAEKSATPVKLADWQATSSEAARSRGGGEMPLAIRASFLKLCGASIFRNRDAGGQDRLHHGFALLQSSRLPVGKLDAWRFFSAAKWRR